MIWHLCHVNKTSLLFHFKYDPVVEYCIEVYFLFSIILIGGDYYVRHSSTNGSTTYANICVFFKIHMFKNNIVFITHLTKHENMLT